MERMRKKIAESFVWVSVDETTDIQGRYVANLLVGRLDETGFFPPHLISMKFLEATNHVTVSRFVNNGLS